MSEAQHIAYLIYKELEGQISEQESIELNSWKQQFPEHTEFFDQVMNEDKFTGLIKANHQDNKEDIREQILERLEGKLNFKVVPIYRRRFFRVAVAACIAALIFVGGYLIIFNNKQTTNPPVVNVPGKDVEAPKFDKAVITLADGKVVFVDNLTTLDQGNVKVIRLEDGRLVYTGFGSEVTFNTLTNPRGSKVIDMTLSDGSHIWLNAGSSITYPTSFAVNERKVSMTGEAYFEIAHDASKPFTVLKGRTSIQVLGTKFNVKAYDDEKDTRVTLIEGSVKVNNNQNSLTIKPNDQAIVTSDAVSLNNNVDVEAVMAWKNGKFLFNNSSIESIMKDVSRWYDVEVVYEGQISGGFGGGIPRDVSISKVLQIMEASNRVHFEIQNKIVIVRP